MSFLFAAYEITRPLSLPPAIDTEEVEAAICDYVLDHWPQASIARLCHAINTGRDAAVAGIEQGRAAAARVMRGDA